MLYSIFGVCIEAFDPGRHSSRFTTNAWLYYVTLREQINNGLIDKQFVNAKFLWQEIKEMGSR
jgi:hypothetical protein